MSIVVILIVEIPIHGYDGSDIADAADVKIDQVADHENPDKDNNTPVEIVHSYRSCGWPERPEEGKDYVHQTDNIHGQTHASKAPASRGQPLWVEDLAVDHATHGNSISKHESSNIQRDDGVERSRGSDVDQRQERTDEARHANSVDWYLALWVYLREPIPKWQAIIASKCIRPTGGRRVE